ncbi:MAG: M28 family peptidase [Nocardioides sp.]
MLSTVQDLVDIAPRVTGTRGGRKASSYVADRFRRAGLRDVHFERATSYNWMPSKFGLSVDGQQIDAFPVSHSLIKGESTPGRTTLGALGRTAPIVDIGPLPLGGIDVRDRFVMFDLKFQLPLAALAAVMEFFWDPALELVNATTLLTANPYLTSLESTYADAMSAGAAGVIVVLADYFESNRYHNEFYRGTAFKIPGMFVTRKTGASIRASLRADSQATMKLTVVRKEVVARTVVGFLPGRTKDTLMVQSHHDSQGPGAVEDGTGTAEVIALADYYGTLARRPGYVRRDKTLMFITFDTHFTGYQSHIAFAQKYLIQRRTPYRIVANATIEHVGKKAVIGGRGQLRTLDQSEPRGIFESLNPALKASLAEILVANDLRASALLNASPFLPVGIPTDASFAVLAGIPVASLIAGPLYMYDEADTMDKVDVGQLRPVARAFQQLIDLMDATPSDLIGLAPAPVLDALPLPLLG